MLIDKIDITIEGGHGGAGKVSFGKLKKSGPDGGDGGKGGDLYFEANSDLTLLNQFTTKTHIKAQDGFPGERLNRTGKKGQDLVVFIPIGTEIIEKETNWVIYDFKETGERKLVCNGGIGGHGNAFFKNSRNTTPLKAQSGLPGDRYEVTLNLKLIADFGLIGLPNSGKSSLLNELTKANAKVGNFSFTTLEPNIGVIPDSRKIIADIPGLIEGASSGKGLGVRFLKHIEKVKTLIHCISSESDNFERDYEVVRNELIKYGQGLELKREIIVFTKSDLVNKKLKFKNSINVSIYDPYSINNLQKILI
jgi:GTP-binding protein